MYYKTCGNFYEALKVFLLSLSFLKLKTLLKKIVPKYHNKIICMRIDATRIKTPIL